MDESFLEDFKPKRSNKNKKKIKSIRLKQLPFILFILLFSSIIIINLKNILNWEKDNQEIKKIETNIEEKIEIEIIEEEGEIINPPKVKESDYWLYIKVPFQNVDLSALKEKNNDTVGFINVKNTNINYPIVQTTNNDYYLNHAYDKSYNEAGWVFMDYRNNNFNDFNTIIYGHGRLNKTVFGSLKDLLKDSWQSNKDNYTLTISSLTMNYVYQIFSIYTIDAESYYIKTEFDNNEEKFDWITEMNNRNTSIIYSPANINDKIITLSTCLNNDNGRIVVHAKLIKQRTKETID
ncbi:MAG: class B sortase [Bacilli bacterium]|nr:class B sortase [Bacilli bacterium]